MPPRVPRASRTLPERRALQDAIAWPIALTLLAGAAVVFFLPRVVPTQFLTVTIGATLALVTVALVAILSVVIERWLRRHAASLAALAESRVQEHGVAGLAEVADDGVLMPLASAYADAGARAALREAEREQAAALLRFGADCAARLDGAVDGTVDPAVAERVRVLTGALRRVTGAVPPAPVPTDLVSEVREVVEALNADGRGARIDAVLDTDRGPVRVDRVRIRGHLHDLLTMARVETAGVGPVTIHVSRVFRSNIEETPVRRTGDSRLTIVPRASDGSLRSWVQRAQPGVEVLSIVIGDGGAAPTTEEQRRAFDAFAVSRPGDPTGVALATIRRTVEEAKGTVWIDGSREGGTAVHLLLPIAGG
ncbi:MAG: sensor histidine kinase [Gemmatimonadaceae bacterium]|nr:sensor histidine kinase [Gemmatimonadaceae bacterium]